MKRSANRSAPLSLARLGEESIDRAQVEVARLGRWVQVADQSWLLGASMWVRKNASGNKAVRPVSVLVQHGETWAVDSQRGDEFQVAVYSTPVTGQGRSAQLCRLCLINAVHECTRYPDAEAVLTCIDHCDGEPCVVVVFDGWDDAVALVGVPGPQGDLADPDLAAVTGED